MKTLQKDTKYKLDNLQPAITERPHLIPGLESLNFEQSSILSFSKVNKIETELESGNDNVTSFYAMIVNGEKLDTSILLFDEKLRLNLHDDFTNLKITQVDTGMQEDGVLFVLDKEKNLVRIDI